MKWKEKFDKEFDICPTYMNGHCCLDNNRESIKQFIQSLINEIKNKCVGEEMELNWEDNIMGEAHKNGYDLKRQEIINVFNNYE